MKTYISGQTATADFAGIADAGLPVGVQVQEITPTVEAQIASDTSEGGFVFVDSGAFTAFVKGESVDFDQVLNDYERLASLTTNPANLAVVAPDAIGNMDLTAELQVAYLDRIKRLANMGVEMLLPLQRGWTNRQYLAHYRLIVECHDIVDRFLCQDIVDTRPLNVICNRIPLPGFGPGRL